MQLSKKASAGNKRFAHNSADSQVRKEQGYKMTITVAGEKKEVKEGLTLPELMELEKVETPEYVTVSINEEFVASGNVADTVLKEGDNVEFLYFMGGGC